MIAILLQAKDESIEHLQTLADCGLEIPEPEMEEIEFTIDETTVKAMHREGTNSGDIVIYTSFGECFLIKWDEGIYNTLKTMLA